MDFISKMLDSFSSNDDFLNQMIPRRPQDKRQKDD
jgi:hypothetical protein